MNPHSQWERRASAASVTLLCLCLCSSGHAVASAPVATPPPRSAQPLAGQIPVTFEQNLGQFDPRARYVARVAGGAVLVGDAEVAIVCADQSRRRGVVRLRYVGADPSVRVAGLDRLPGVANYFRGADPSRWRAGVPTFGAARVRGLYPGIDVAYYVDGPTLEFDYVVSPGADVRAIRFAVDGAAHVRVDPATGDLVLGAGDGAPRLQAPAIYQLVAGAKQSVAGRYVARGVEVGLEVGDYDRTLPLVVDPAIRYSTYVGGSNVELYSSVVVDASGNAYLAGNTFSTDFPTTPGAFQLDMASDDVVVTKLAPGGNALVYSTYLGGGAGDFGNGIAIDAAGNAIVTGSTFSTNFPTTNGFAADMTGADAFLTKLNATGTTLLYSTYLGGSGTDGAAAVAAEPGGVAYVTGSTDSIDFQTTPSAYQAMRLVAATTTFVTKIDTTASGAASLLYSTYLGDTGAGEDVAVGAGGAAYVTGFSDGTMFPTTIGAFQTDQPGRDAFVAKIDTTASGAASLVYSTYLGGGAADTGHGIAVDATGAAHVSGETTSTNFPTTASAFQPSPPGLGSGDIDAFATKVNATGTALVYSTYLGGSGDDIGTSIAVDAGGAMDVTGNTFSSDFPTASPLFDYDADSDVFVSRLHPARTAMASLVFSTYLGGADRDLAFDIALDSHGEAYIAGFTNSPDFPTVNPYQGDQPTLDAFVTKLSLVVAAVAGTDTIAAIDEGSGAFFLRNTNTPGPADVLFNYGGGGLTALSGDWDGDGDDTPGLYAAGSGAFFLKNANAAGGADLVFNFGPGGSDFAPITGDWDGDGVDTIGIYHQPTGTFFLKNTNAPGGADLVFTFGAGGPDFAPITGDWDGDGVDTIGVYHRPTGTFFLRNANAPGGADLVFSFGAGGAGLEPVTGDWNADGVDTIGVYIPATATWFLRNSNTPGAADLAFSYGPPNLVPLTGDWDGL
jgi:hypothetical protein